MHTAKVFKSGNSHAVRIPNEFSIDEEELYIQKIGRALILISKKEIWDSFEESLDSFSEDLFQEGRDQPEKPQGRESL